LQRDLHGVPIRILSIDDDISVTVNGLIDAGTSPGEHLRAAAD
jgi:hypothetical protein